MEAKSKPNSRIKSDTKAIKPKKVLKNVKLRTTLIISSTVLLITIISTISTFFIYNSVKYLLRPQKLEILNLSKKIISFSSMLSLSKKSTNTHSDKTTLNESNEVQNLSSNMTSQQQLEQSQNNSPPSLRGNFSDDILREVLVLAGFGLVNICICCVLGVCVDVPLLALMYLELFGNCALGCCTVSWFCSNVVVTLAIPRAWYADVKNNASFSSIKSDSDSKSK